MIRRERDRQIDNYGVEHDDEHVSEELARAAACLSTPVLYRQYAVMVSMWPWRPHEFQSGDRVEDLVRAGALIAAEIDRLIRLKEKRSGQS